MPDIFHLHLFGDDAGVHHDSTIDHHHDLGGLSDHPDVLSPDHTHILGTDTDVPWLHFGPHAASHDADHDHIPDAVDHFVGPGPDAGGVLAPPDVPWLHFGPDAGHHDADHDGVPDALDHHVGFGAQDLAPGALSSGVPWEQITPHAMQHDTDHDGIPDALDNNVGPGPDPPVF